MTVTPGIAIVGRGRVGHTLAEALQGAHGPFGRGFDGRRPDGTAFEAVILAVPDGQIAVAANAIAAGPLVGHCAGAVGIGALAPHEAFGLHPLMTITRSGASLAGAAAAVAGSTPRALALAHQLAAELGMRSFEIDDASRPAYHAAASIASNFLLTLEAAAERMMASVTDASARELLGPLVRATVTNWLALGPERALTGPIARGDDATVRRQREAVAREAPELLPMFDALVEATKRLASRTGTT